MLNPHLIKRSLIVLSYLGLFTIIGLALYFWLTPKATCSDGKQNQNEKEIDCGGSCAPCKINYAEKELIVGEKAFVSGGNNTYDVVVKVSNPNDAVGATSFHYVLNLKDATEKVIATSEGDDYILPADSKYVVQIGLSTLDNTIPTQAEFMISDATWSQLGKVEKPQISVYDRKFGPDFGGVSSKAEGLIRNESAFDFKKIKLVVILRAENGEVLGVSTTEEENVRAGMESGFALTWPYTFPAVVRNMEVDVQTNIFDSENFSTGL
jgi:hypothetical protein